MRRSDPGDQKMLKIKVPEIARKWIHCIDLILTIPMQLEQDQTDYVWLIYRVLSAFPNRQNIDYVVCTCHMEVDHTIIQVD
jgi:hypothetical protein